VHRRTSSRCEFSPLHPQRPFLDIFSFTPSLVRPFSRKLYEVRRCSTQSACPSLGRVSCLHLSQKVTAPLFLVGQSLISVKPFVLPPYGLLCATLLPWGLLLRTFFAFLRLFSLLADFSFPFSVLKNRAAWLEEDTSFNQYKTRDVFCGGRQRFERFCMGFFFFFRLSVSAPTPMLDQRGLIERLHTRPFPFLPFQIAV